MSKIRGRVLYFSNSYDLNEDKNYNMCCEELRFHIFEKERPLFYIAKFREYSLKCRLDWSGGGILQEIDFCPFCGKKLPNNLRNEWFEELEKLGFDDPLEQDIPEEFKDDTWWKNRNL